MQFWAKMAANSTEIGRDLCVIAAACGLFQLLSVLVSGLFVDFKSWIVSSRLRNQQRRPSLSPDELHWKWKNTFVSLIHSTITGFGAVACFYSMPEMAEDLINVYSTLAQNLVAVSLGYFVYDSIDMLRFHRTRSSFELLVHHAVILICFGIAIVTHTYIGYAIVALIVELNSIFLHLRQLMQLSGVSKSSSVYRFNGLLNLGTYIVFRIATLAWMTRWVIINREAIPLVFYTVGSIGLAIITTMSVILFSRLLQSDFVLRKNALNMHQE